MSGILTFSVHTRSFRCGTVPFAQLTLGCQGGCIIEDTSRKSPTLRAAPVTTRLEYWRPDHLRRDRSAGLSFNAARMS